MAEKTQIDTKRLWELVQMGKSDAEIMEVLDIREEASLKEALEAVMREKGENETRRGTIGKPSLNARYTGGGIRISPGMLEGSTFKKGDEFEVMVTEDGISLKRRKGKFGPPDF